MANKRRPLEERRTEIVRAALEVVARVGFRAMTTRDVARGAGVREPIVYRAFGSKRGLVRACLEEASERILASVEASLRGGSLGGLVRRYYPLYRILEREHLVLYHAVAESGDPEVRRLARDLYRRHADQLADALGCAVPARRSRAVAWLLISAAHFYIVRRRFGIRRADVIAEVLGALLSGGRR